MRIVCWALSVSMLATSARAMDKNECLAAADEGQELRDASKLARARAAFVACSREECPPLVVKQCAAWLVDLDRTMPTVIFALRDARGADVVDASVRLDGELLEGALAGAPVAVDPGDHTVRFERDRSAPLEQRVVVRLGEKNRLIEGTLVEPRPKAPEPPSAIDKPPIVRSYAERNTIAIALGGLAAAALGTGVYFNLAGRNAADDAARFRSANSPSACAGQMSGMCADWSAAVDAQARDATWGRVFYVAGGVLAAGALVTLLFWPSRTVHF